MSRYLISFGLFSCYFVLLLSLIFGTGRQALALQPLATSAQLLEDMNGIPKELKEKQESKEKQENSRQASLQAVPLISLLLPQNTHSDTMCSSKRLLPSRILPLYAFTQSFCRYQQASVDVSHYLSRVRLLALQKLRLEGG